MRYKVGALQLEQMPSSPTGRGGLQVGQDRPIGPTHAVDTATGAVACGIEAAGLHVLNDDWEGRSLLGNALPVSSRSSPKASGPWRELFAA